MVAGESVTYFLVLMAFDARAGGLARMISVARGTAFRTVLFGSFRLGCNRVNARTANAFDEWKRRLILCYVRLSA